MNKFKKNITLFLTVFIFAITCAFTFSIENSYAASNGNSSSKIEYQVAKGSFKSSSRSFKPSSGSSFKPSSSSSKSSSSYTKQKPSTTKPDSGSFSTKPKPETTINEGSSGKNSSGSTTKPDSGSFSTKPNTNSKSNENDSSKSNNKKYDDYGGSSRKTYIPHTYGRGFFGFGGYNPFRYMGYRMGISPLITDIVMVITILIVLYIIIDFIRNRKNR
ncbi:hypothetical protein GCM10008904_12260 [Paraclostridium ghonii]|uniref:DNA mismatch repair ATPase MutL n=1 Tax=Paraclostridium ghonii TaxID=29358 RepID=A0ABU0N1G7_9FIRM|nr:hypothetical protein [Paeniclostridium ghonii]MDQ0557007.1 DNA mismatch repair ATPase MutL [Paeniclostridium ghonii]